jgi:hypothetical protein
LQKVQKYKFGWASRPYLHFQPLAVQKCKTLTHLIVQKYTFWRIRWTCAGRMGDMLNTHTSRSSRRWMDCRSVFVLLYQ